MNHLVFFNTYHFILVISFIFFFLLPVQLVAQGNVKQSNGLISYIDVNKGELVLLRKLYTFKSNVKVIMGKQLFPTVRDLTSRVYIQIRYTVVKGENRISRIEVIPI